MSFWYRISQLSDDGPRAELQLSATYTESGHLVAWHILALKAFQETKTQEKIQPLIDKITNVTPCIA